MNSVNSWDPENGSQLHCIGDSIDSRRCVFKNLCFYPKKGKFLFIHGIETEFYGIGSKDRSIYASTVLNHSGNLFEFLDVFPEFFVENSEKFEYFSENFLLIRRFLPSNIMHAFHDDLIPLYLTLKELREIFGISDEKKIQIIFDDSHENSNELYTILFPNSIHINQIPTLTCFEKIFVGLSRESIWYQYGFERFQGPILKENFFHFREFSHFFQQKFGISNLNQKKSSKKIVFLSRTESRRILNEKELIETLAKVAKVSILRLESDSFSLKEMIQEISSSSCLLGMHGSALILGLFLPPKSFLIEIFPFGLKAEHLQPYQTLTKLPGMELFYRFWENFDESSTLSHPENSPEFGGINHLSESEQKRIKEFKLIPPQKCCDSPEFLYRMYQDTRVNIDAISELVMECLNSDQIPVKEEFRNFYPGKVENIHCLKLDENDLTWLQWDPPWNIPVNSKPQFEVWFENHSSKTSRIFKLNEAKFEIPTNLEFSKIWIRCIFDGNSGPFLAFDAEFCDFE
jgi:protein O-mannose beta-1,4-N-acetylglucosaminyltransferase